VRWVCSIFVFGKSFRSRALPHRVIGSGHRQSHSSHSAIGLGFESVQFARDMHRQRRPLLAFNEDDSTQVRTDYAAATSACPGKATCRQTRSVARPPPIPANARSAAVRAAKPADGLRVNLLHDLDVRWKQWSGPAFIASFFIVRVVSSW